MKSSLSPVLILSFSPAKSLFLPPIPPPSSSTSSIKSDPVIFPLQGHIPSCYLPHLSRSFIVSCSCADLTLESEPTCRCALLVTTCMLSSAGCVTSCFPPSSAFHLSFIWVSGTLHCLRKNKVLALQHVFIAFLKS